MWHGPHNGPKASETKGSGDRAGDGMWREGPGHGMGREAESTKQQPRGIGKPVAMEW